jgi:hypothetical protein
MRAERRIELTPEKVNGRPAVGDIVLETKKRRGGPMWIADR